MHLKDWVETFGAILEQGIRNPFSNPDGSNCTGQVFCYLPGTGGVNVTGHGKSSVSVFPVGHVLLVQPGVFPP